MFTARTHRSDNPGIVPPWLTQPVQPGNENPGIVPPWLTDAPHILPVTPNAAVQTAFVREPAGALPTPALADVLRSR